MIISRDTYINRTPYSLSSLASLKRSSTSERAITSRELVESSPWQIKVIFNILEPSGCVPYRVHSKFARRGSVRNCHSPRLEGGRIEGSERSTPNAWRGKNHYSPKARREYTEGSKRAYRISEREELLLTEVSERSTPKSRRGAHRRFEERALSHTEARRGAHRRLV